MEQNYIYLLHHFLFFYNLRLIPLKTLQKSTISSGTISCPTGPNQLNLPKFQIMFHKENQPQDFIRKTLDGANDIAPSTIKQENDAQELSDDH